MNDSSKEHTFVTVDTDGAGFKFNITPDYKVTKLSPGVYYIYFENAYVVIISSDQSGSLHSSIQEVECDGPINPAIIKAFDGYGMSAAERNLELANMMNETFQELGCSEVPVHTHRQLVCLLSL